MPENCPYKVGEIVLFDCPYRKEKYIAQVKQHHIDKWGTKLIADIHPATMEQKKLWYESGKEEVIIERTEKPPDCMSITFRLDDFSGDKP